MGFSVWSEASWIADGKRDGGRGDGEATSGLQDLRSQEGVGKTPLGHRACVLRRDRGPQSRSASGTDHPRKRPEKQQLAGGERGGFLEDGSVCEIRATVEVGKPGENLVGEEDSLCSRMERKMEMGR